MDEQRQAFEQWARDIKLWRGFQRSEFSTEQYENEAIQAAWEAWQAATELAKKMSGKSWVI
ncbi:MAG TPA: hypothetical protein VIF82_13370 [Burkholderiaceae bacterium]|jgi:hypothetical protein